MRFLVCKVNEHPNKVEWQIRAQCAPPLENPVLPSSQPRQDYCTEMTRQGVCYTQGAELQKFVKVSPDIDTRH